MSLDTICRYFHDILKATPESVEDVVVEADGEWHTADNKYGSLNWKAAHPVVASSSPAIAESKPIPLPATSGSMDSNHTKASDVDIVILDSDDEDEDEGQVKRELSPSYRGAVRSVSATGSQQAFLGAGGVIDLTLDSDGEADVAPAQPTTRTEKRKVSDDGLSGPATKKARTDMPPPSHGANGWQTTVPVPSANQELRPFTGGSVAYSQQPAALANSPTSREPASMLSDNVVYQQTRPHGGGPAQFSSYAAGSSPSPAPSRHNGAPSYNMPHGAHAQRANGSQPGKSSQPRPW